MLNYVDVLLLLIIGLSVLSGWQKGFLIGMLDLFRWIGSLLIALHLYPYAAGLLPGVVDWSEAWITPAAFFLVFVLANLLLHYLGYLLLNRIPEEAHERKVNRALGILPGLVNGLITAAIAAVVLMLLPLSEGIRTQVRESRLANWLASKTERAETALSPIFGGAVERTLTRLAVRPASDELVKLPFAMTDAPPRPDLENQMLNLVNRERQKVSLPPLQPDPELTAVARRHSADMMARSYFSHMTPDGVSPEERIRAARVRFRVSGENLAIAPTLTVAHNGLMNSPGHRANILESRFGRAGIGILDGGVYGLVITQNFRN